MSKEDVARYRVPPVRPRSRRTLVEVVPLRLPRLARLLRSALLRLPLHSRLRRELVARGIRDSAEAWNRGDRELFLAAIDPEVEFNVVNRAAGVDLEDRYDGHEGARRYWATIDEAWETIRVEPQEMIDFGDRYLVLQTWRARGRGSGVEVEHDIGLFVTWSRGMSARVDFYWSREEALEAAGLGE
jgi:ketosteroid isomerase-like protein